MHRRVSRGALTITFSLYALTAYADDFCTRLDTLIDIAGQPGSAASFDLASTPTDCAHSLGLGRTVALHCAWPFAYRAPDATALFADTMGKVATCAKPIAPDTSTVSHPDSYDLRQFTRGNATISVSLKDKAALAQTYIFLRVERPAP